MMEKTKEAALQWVKDGRLCTYRFGLAYRGAGARRISNEEALNKLTNEKAWDFGMGFYTLRWTTFEGENCLEFNELHENDLY